MAFRKKAGDDGLDVLTELKEPFTFAGFYEDHILARAKAAKKFLDEKGILFFLLSPFMQRSRLILQLAVITAGILIGIVPRSLSLIEQAKERNAASEMASLIESGDAFSSGSVRILPLASSQYEKQHLLAFLLEPSAGGSVPSKADRYEVTLTALRGVSDEGHVSYSYEVIPVSESKRLLLVYTDNREQLDDTGIYGLTVRVPADGADHSLEEPMEIVLSNTQDTTDLFGPGGIDLSALTDGVLADGRTPIKDAKAKLEKALLDYELEAERIQELPLDLAAVPSVAELTAFAEDGMQYKALDDASTTKDIERMEEIPDNALNLSPQYPAAIALGGELYDEERFSALGSGLSENEETAAKELQSLQAKADAVMSALGSLNAAANTKYQSLKAYKLVLNQKVSAEGFTGAVRTVGEPTEDATGGEAEPGGATEPKAPGDAGE